MSVPKNVITLLPGESFSATMTFQHKEDGEIVIKVDFPGAQLGASSSKGFEAAAEAFSRYFPTRVLPLFRMQTKTKCQQD